MKRFLLAVFLASALLGQTRHEYGGLLIENGVNNLGTIGGTNTYTAAPSPALAGYAQNAEYCGYFTNANTGAATLNINSLGAISIVKLASTALASGDIAATSSHCVVYNGSAFILQSPDNASGGGSGTVTTTGSPSSGQVAAFSGATSVTTATGHNMVASVACADSSGSGSAQVCNTSPTFTPAAGDQIVYATTTANTGDVTVNVNSLGAKHVRKWLGASVLAAGDLVANTPITLTYDGTFWEIPTIGNAPSGGGGSAFSAITGGTNSSAAMLVGTGASLSVSGSGTINSTQLNGNTPGGSCSNQVVTSLNSSAVPTCGSVTSSLMSAVNTRRVCDIAIGDASGSAIASAQLGPQKRICYIPAAATIIEMDVAADGGTPNVIVGKNHAGTVTNIVSAALATAASGGIACSNSGGTTGIDGATTCSSTLQNTSLAAGDYLELVSGTAGGTAKLMTIHVVYTVN